MLESNGPTMLLDGVVADLQPLPTGCSTRQSRHSNREEYPREEYPVMTKWSESPRRPPRLFVIARELPIEQ